jgi:hypothetical protein
MQTTTEILSKQDRARHSMAVTALRNAGFDMDDDLRGEKFVSPISMRQVWLQADILLGDERILLRWMTAQGVEVADAVRINIDTNAGAFVAALASVKVYA